MKKQENDIKLLSAFLENASALIVVLDREGRIFRFNPACEELSGYSENEVLGRFVWDFLLLPEEQEAVKVFAFDALVNDPERLQGSYTNYWVDRQGKKHLIEWKNSLILDDNKNFEYLLSIGIDITEKKEIEDELKRSQETYTTAESITHIGAWDWNIVTNALHWTDEIYRIFGKTPQSFAATYEAFLEAVHPEDQQKVIDAVNESVSDPDKHYNIEHRVVRPDGEIRYVHEQGKVYRDNGSPMRMIGTVHDITERVLMERFLREKEQQHRLTLSLSPVVIYTCRAEDDFGATYVSPNIETIFGYKPEQFTDDSSFWLDHIHPEDHQRVIRDINEVFNNNKHHHEYRFRMPNGDYHWVHDELRLLLDKDGKPEQMIGAMMDIHEQKKLDEELVRYREHLEDMVNERTQDLLKAKEEADRANLAKSEFLSRMSHELRTPMNAILGFSQILEFESLSDSQKSFVSEIRRAGDHLLDLIRELLDLARIEEGRLEILIQQVLVKSAVEESINLVTGLQNQLKITIENLCDKGLVVLADPTRLKQIFVNLLSNAIKYNQEKGSVRISCEQIPGSLARIRITDTGPGISEENLEKIFVPFERLGPQSRHVDGTGIGLALSQKLVGLMGGSIGVESAVGKGSTFWIDLPIAVTSELDESHTGKLIAPGVELSTVLYIEDNAANLRLIEAMFSQQEKLTLISAMNGEHGIELAERFLPDLILLDIHLPGMSGYGVFEKLQENPRTRDIPVIALTADAMPLDVEKGLQVGFKHYLTKPVAMNDLFDAVYDVIN